MPRFDRAAAAVGALVIAVCAAPSCRRASAPPLVLPLSPAGLMVFPPPEDTLLDRDQLAARARQQDDERVHVSSPSFDDQGHFEISGQDLEMTFDEPLFAKVDNAPKIVITPSFGGKTSWSEDGERVVVHADKMLDPKQTFEIDIPQLVTPSGKTFEHLHASFEAVPEVIVAGKTIHYLPEPGRPRLIILRSGDNAVSATEEVVAIYDQPVDLGLAWKLVTISDEHDKKMAASIRHPATGIFEGQKVDPRDVLLLRPAKHLVPGEQFSIEAKSRRDDDESDRSSFTVVGAPVVSSMSCTNQGCTVDGSKISGPASSDLRIAFDRSLGTSISKKNVTITPPVANLWVSAYDELEIGGSFEASKTYRIDVRGVRDSHGSWIAPISAVFVTDGLPASATLADGASLLDEAAVKAYPVTTRNVVKGTLLLRPLPAGDTKAFEEAISGVLPTAPPLEIPFTPHGRRNDLVDTTIDLSSQVERGRPYVVSVRMDEVTGGSALEATPGSAVIYPAGPNAIGAHVHQTGDLAIVELFRLSTGEPVANAKVVIGAASGTTDALGTATVNGSGTVLVATAGDATLMLPLTDRLETRSDALYPELSGQDERSSVDAGVLVTDRGIYRPGSSIHIKGFLRKMQGTSFAPKGKAAVHLQAIDPMGTAIADRALTTDARGGVSESIEIDKHAHTGKLELRLLEGDALVASETVHVADFETPRFKVDVESTTPGEMRIIGKHLFGTPLDGGAVSWVLKRVPAEVDGSGMPELHFDRETSWFEEPVLEKPLTGEGSLGADGVLVVKTSLPPAKGPTTTTFEADVSDRSNRHVGGSLKKHDDPLARHAGLAIEDRFGDGDIDVKLGAVDPSGHAVIGAKVTAKVERLKWTAAGELGESGATIERWKYVSSPVGSCEITSAATPVDCKVHANVGGELRVTARVDGHDDASAYYWAYGWGGEVPSNGKKIPIVLDRGHYAPGDTAHLLVQNPWKKAIALLTIEEGHVVRHETKRVEGPSVTFDVAVTAAEAPFFHAAVTLLPIGEREADYRIAVARLPVSGGEDKVAVSVVSNQKTYRPRERAEVTIEVKRGGQPVRNADVALSVADEGVLRLTGFHAKDPALRTGHPLDFDAFDSRAVMLKRRERAHTAGDGGDAKDEPPDTRRKFVETAAWMPSLVTDDQGRVKVSFELPDNLGELRMMAVVLDGSGAGGSAESSFLVNKPLMIEPVVPRFALHGDVFEMAAMAHNQTDAEVHATVSIAGVRKDIVLPAHGHERVGIPFTAAHTTQLRFALETDGKIADAVEIPFRVDEPGIEEHPRISGVFGKEQEIRVEIPADAVFDDDAALVIKTGSALYPELGQRLSYLLDYPHGCVEQTTSSTLPLLAARTLLPWTGTKPMADTELKKRIKAGVDRLATMQTTSGALAYWPGGTEPHLYGTAYAMRALVRARAIGIERPQLIERAAAWLKTQLSGSSPETRVVVAEALAIAGELPASEADTLFDQREHLQVYGLASLAIALSSLPKQEDRVSKLLDDVESSFDDEGASNAKHGEDDWQYWGSTDRDRAQAAIALAKLRHGSKKLPIIASRLARGLERWTTQSTAWSLLAIADFVDGQSPDGRVDVEVKVEGWAFDSYEKLGGDNKEVRVPLKVLAGQKRLIRLRGDASVPSAFAIDAVYKRPITSSPRVSHRLAHGISLYREFTTPEGNAVDLAHVKAGSLLRVTIRAHMPPFETWRLGYVAVTDRVPAGLDPIDPDLSTNVGLPDATPASHFDIRPDRIDLYFDHAYGDVVATYFARATTKGTFTLPPAIGEMMYEPGSEGWSDAGRVVVE